MLLKHVEFSFSNEQQQKQSRVCSSLGLGLVEVWAVRRPMEQ